jgi:hypothetical protein
MRATGTEVEVLAEHASPGGGRGEARLIDRFNYLLVYLYLVVFIQSPFHVQQQIERIHCAHHFIDVIFA